MITHEADALMGRLDHVIRDEPFRQFVRVMFETGARPGEVARVTAADVNLELGVWVFTRHKTAKKTRRPQAVYLPPAVVELCRGLIARFPEGPIFRGPRGQRPFKRNNIRCRFRRLRKKLPHLKHFVAYTARHTFVTHALRNNVGNPELFDTLLEARVLTERWRRGYNTVRPHSALGYKPPAPEVVLVRPPEVVSPTGRGLEESGEKRT